MPNKPLNPPGFTLIEILITLSIISILSTMATAIFRGITLKVSDVAEESEVNSIAKALESHYNPVNGGYLPLQSSWFSKGVIPTPGDGGSYFTDLSLGNQGFRVCTVTGGSGSCSAASASCYCKDSQQGDYIASVPSPSPSSLPSPSPSPSPTSVPGNARLFVTTPSYNADLKTAGSAVGLGVAATGLDGADKICQSRANSASLGGTWKAWLSDAGTSAASRMTHHTGQYINSGDVVANSWADLTDGTILNNLDKTEIGNTANNFVWTDTAIDGSTRDGNDCYAWTSSVFELRGGVGKSDQLDADWTAQSGATGVGYCSDTRNLYCVEQ